MAKILCNYFGLSMAAEGKSEFVGRQAAAFLGYVQQDAERCAENCGCAEDLSDAPEKTKREILRNDEELRRREQTAPGVEHDVVAIYDNAGIPSIMHRFRRVTNKELFGGSDAVHPAFIIGGEVYDEIYISVYENTMINGKPYSLPLQEPVTNITMKSQEKNRCPLCERHQRMETTSGMLFWVEWGEDGNPRLCTDTLHDGGGLNVLCIDFCPLCGREVEKQEALG